MADVKKVSARITIESAEAGSDALIEMLEQVLELAKSDPEALRAGVGESKDVVFERRSASEFIGASHRS